MALTVLEKLEYAYSNSWIASREYEKALELALRQCNKCHELVKVKVGFLGFPSHPLCCGFWYHLDKSICSGRRRRSSSKIIFLNIFE